MNSQLKDNKDFYPTPPLLLARMIAKIKGNPQKILDSGAGMCAITDGVKESFRWGKPDIFCTETDPIFQAVIREKGYRLLHDDLLSFTGPDQFDLIISNPPFADGDKHLLKAIDMVYSGQIVFQLNAETLRNPHTNTRKELVRKLDDLGAEIDYISDAYLHAERKTNVEIALINIIVKVTPETDIFGGVDDVAYECTETIKDKHEVSTGRTVEEMVLEYNEVINAGNQSIIDFYRNHSKIGSYVELKAVSDRDQYTKGNDRTELLRSAVNKFAVDVRKNFWRKTLDLEEVRGRLTSKKQEEFESALNDQCYMDFTENNVRTFVLGIIGSYEQILTEAVLDVFDMFTIRHAYDDVGMQKNIHMFNGWKTNDAFKVGKRVVIPIRAGYGSAFWDPHFSKLSVHYSAKGQLNDIDKVMNYFDGMGKYTSLVDSITEAFAEGEQSGESTYFKFKAHKKGTIHLTFLDSDILRRFNVVACKGKGWLPSGYGSTEYKALPPSEQVVVDEFEGSKSYGKNVGVKMMPVPDRLMIGG